MNWSDDVDSDDLVVCQLFLPGVDSIPLSLKDAWEHDNKKEPSPISSTGFLIEDWTGGDSAFSSVASCIEDCAFVDEPN